MKNNSNKPKKKVEEMRAEYDFSGDVRGKHAEDYQKRHSVIIHKKDGTNIFPKIRKKAVKSRSGYKHAAQSVSVSNQYSC